MVHGHCRTHWQDVRYGTLHTEALFLALENTKERVTSVTRLVFFSSE